MHNPVWGQIQSAGSCKVGRHSVVISKHFRTYAWKTRDIDNLQLGLQENHIKNPENMVAYRIKYGIQYSSVA